MTWNTDSAAMKAAVEDFEAALPSFWWSVGQCSVGAHASCAVDPNGGRPELLNGIEAGHPFDSGFHCDTIKQDPHVALRDVMRQALEFIETNTTQSETE